MQAVMREIDGRQSALVAESVVSLRGVTKIFRAGKERVVALKGISLEIGAGEFIAVTGPSGSGKTTLLNLTGCLDHPDSGSILIDGLEVEGLPSRALARLRAEKIGLVFQNFNLIPVLSVGENVEYPLLLGGSPPDKRRRQRMVEDILAELGIESLIDRRPGELSGGQCQRAAIARALITNPRIVIADEPTSSLDSRTGASILCLMKSLNHQRGVTFIFSTHDLKLVDLADRVIELCDGEIQGWRSE
jgi:putative ABC transport system ATP-binding protein